MIYIFTDQRGYYIGACVLSLQTKEVDMLVLVCYLYG